MIYLDNAATYVENNDDVLNYFCDVNKKFFANANSNHYLGYIVDKELNKAKTKIIELLNLNSDYDVIFNSGASEGINHAIKGYAFRNISRGKEIIVFKNEHSAVLETTKILEKQGFKITFISCDKNGEINYEELKNKINNQTIMVVTMAVNNEVGAINDLKKIYNIIKHYPKCVFFSDVTQAIGKVEINYNFLDMFVFSAHKIGGLIGSGVLIKKKKILLEKLIVGGPQENNYRSGTETTSLSLTTTYVLQKKINNLDKNNKYVHSLKKNLIDQLNTIKEVEINSYNNFNYLVNFSLKSKKASVVVEALSNLEIYVSSLSACNSKKNIASHVLINMGKNKQIAENSIRVSFSSKNTVEEVLIFAEELKKILKKIK